MVSNIIKQNRMSLKLTQSQLAEKLSVTKATVSKWELNQSYPDIHMLPRLADIFAITIDELLDYHPQCIDSPETVIYSATLDETGFRYEEVYNQIKIDKLWFNMASNGYSVSQADLSWRLTVSFNFSDSKIIDIIQKHMPDKTYFDMIEKHSKNGQDQIYHLWVCKDEVLKFKLGCKAEIKRAAHRLIEKGILDDDYIY